MISVTITHTNGETTAYRFALAEGVRYRIGRDTSCEISLPNEEYLSRVHCFILYSNGQLMIQDNQSSNGVFLGDQRITSDFLVMNQPYRIGYCYMTVQEDDTPDEQEVPYQAAPAYASAYPPSSAYSVPTQAYPTPTQPYPVPQAYPPSSGYPQVGAYPAPQAYPQPEAYPAQQVYPQPVAYPQAEAYPAQQVYPQPAIYPQAEAYPTQQVYPQPGVYPQVEAYPAQQAYPQAAPYPAPTSYPQAYPTSSAYPQVSGYPQADTQPSVYPQQGDYVAPEPQAYPLPESSITPDQQVYPLPEFPATPEPQAYPLPESPIAPEPQTYPLPESPIAPESQVYPLPESPIAPEPQTYPLPESPIAPESQVYPLPESSATPEPQAYPLPESSAAPESQAYPLPESPATPEPQACPLPESSTTTDQHAEEKSGSGESAASMEEMLASELAAEKKADLRGKLSGIVSAGKNKFGHWSLGRRKDKGSADKEESTQPEEQHQPPVEEKSHELTDQPSSDPISDDAKKIASPREKAPEHSSSPGSTSTLSQKKPEQLPVDHKKKQSTLVHKKTGKKTLPPELELKGLPGSLLDLPTDFMVHFRVTTPAAQFEEGAPLRFYVKADCDCRVYIVAHDSQGGAELIMPGEDGTDNMVFPAVEAKFPNIGRTGYQMVVEPPFGTETVVLLAVATTHKCDFAKELHEKLKQSSPDQRPGQVENQALLAFREKHAKHAKFNKLAWSSAVLNITTVPKQGSPVQDFVPFSNL